MEDKNILLAANIIFNSKLNRKTLNALPENLIPKNINEAYSIQNELKILYLTLNDNIIIGKKIACTNLEAQRQLNIFEPFHGNLFSKYTDNSGCSLKSNNFCKPYIEPEISFRIKNDININKAPFTEKNVLDLFDVMTPSIEIVDFRFGDNIKEIGAERLISANAASEFYIKSNNFFPLDFINLNDHSVKLFINEKLVEEGNTNLVLKNPINSAIWLLNKLCDIGEPMLKGQFISTGTCTKAYLAESNSLIKADFGKLGSVEFNYN